VKILAQNAIFIQPISIGLQNTGEDSLHFEMEIQARQEAMNIGWFLQKIPESSVAIPSGLIGNYDGISSLKTEELTKIKLAIPANEMGVPITLLLHLISLDEWVKIPIPYLFQINELDVDTPGLDTQEFLEILAPSLPFASLNGIEITAINGSNERVSRRWNLSEDAFIANEVGLFMLTGRELELPNQMQYHSLQSTSNLFQNGSSQQQEADAVSINWVINDLDQSFVIDALIYDTNPNSRDEELAALLQMPATSVIEGVKFDKELSSLQRYPSLISAVKNGDLYVEMPPTPGKIQHFKVGEQTDNDQWLKIGVPEGVKLIDWIEPSLYTQGAIGADIEEGDPIAYYWEEGAFVPVIDLNQEVPINAGIFIYVTNLTHGYGLDGWPKTFGSNLKKPITVSLMGKDMLLKYEGQGENIGLNLVANPFPIPMDIQPILADYDEVIELAKWNPIAKEYEVWNGQNGDLSSTIVEPYSGFWLRVNAESTVSIIPKAKKARILKQEKDSEIKDASSNSEQLLFSLEADDLSQKVIIAKRGKQFSADELKDISYRSFDTEQQLKFYLGKRGNSASLKLSYINESEWDFAFEADVFIDNPTATKNLKLSFSQEMAKKFDVQLVDFLTNTRIPKTTDSSWSIPEIIEDAHRFTLQFKRASSTTITDQQLPKRLKLHQNYPNPFNPTTTISFELATASTAQFEIFDSLGRLVYDIAPKYYTKGLQTIAIQASKNWQTGVYFYRIRLQNGEELQKKMTLIK
jgi:hypothetical protein